MYRRLCTERGVKTHALLEQILDTAGVSVDLGSLYVGPKQCRLVVEIVRDAMKTIEHLSLAGNSLSPEVITFLCESVKSLAFLERLDLSKNQLGIQSGRELLQMVQECENLFEVNLEETMLPEYLIADINTQLEANRYNRENKNQAVTKQDVPLDTNYNWEWLSNVGDEQSFLRDQEMVNEAINAPTAQPPLEVGGSSSLASSALQKQNAAAITAGGRSSTSGSISSSTPPPSTTTTTAISSTNAVATGGVSKRPRRLLGDTLNPIPLFLQPNELQISMGLERTKFTDEEFPAEPTSMFSMLTHHEAKLLTKGVVWQRLSELEGCTTTPIIVPSSSSSGGGGGFLSYIHQGPMFSTRWFRSALIVVQQDPQALKLICVKSFADIGMYTFRFHKCGVPVEVTVDDLVPVFSSSGKPCVCHHEDPNHLFAPLLEKAYAKLHGGYDRLNRGSLTSAIGDLIGGATLKTSWSLPSIKSSIDSMVDRVREAVIRGTLLIAQSTCVGELQEKSQWAAGIEPNLAYVVNGVKKVANFTLFRLVASNPNLRWNGRFAIDTPEYLEFANELPTNMQGIPSPESSYAASDSAEKNNNNGTTSSSKSHHLTTMAIRNAPVWFWMPVEDFVSFFTSIREVRHPLHVPAAIEQQTVAQRAFVMGEGGIYGSNEWTNNCSYYLSAVEKNLDVVIVLSQPDQRLRSNQPLEYATSLQLHALKAPADGPTSKCRTFNASDILKASPLVQNREVAISLTLQPHEPIHIVATVSGTSSCPFEIRVTAPHRFRFAELTDRLMNCTLSGEWLSSSAAGRIDARNNYAGLRNPQFNLKVERQQEIGFVLSQLRQDVEPHTVALTCYRSSRQITTLDDDNNASGGGNNNSTMSDGSSSSPTVIFQADYRAERSIGVSLRTFEPGSYVLIPSTWSAGEDGPFAIKVFSEFPVEGSRLNM